MMGQDLASIIVPRLLVTRRQVSTGHGKEHTAQDGNTNRLPLLSRVDGTRGCHEKKKDKWGCYRDATASGGYQKNGRKRVGRYGFRPKMTDLTGSLPISPRRCYGILQGQGSAGGGSEPLDHVSNLHARVAHAGLYHGRSFHSWSAGFHHACCLRPKYDQVNEQGSTMIHEDVFERRCHARDFLKRGRKRRSHRQCMTGKESP
eukprot:3607762-Rhodomonas_salina.2